MIKHYNKKKNKLDVLLVILYPILTFLALLPRYQFFSTFFIFLAVLDDLFCLCVTFCFFDARQQNLKKVIGDVF